MTWQNRKFWPTYFAPTPQRIRLGAAALFKLPQTQRFGLPAASAYPDALFSQIAITTAAQVTHKGQKQPTTRLRQYYCSRSILYLRHPQMHRSKRKVLDDRNAKFSHPKSTFSPFTKWYWQNQKFCPTSSAPTPQCIRLSERAKFKVPQTQRFGLPAALGSLPTLCSPVAITQTAQVTRKSHKQPTTRKRQHCCWRPILDRPRSQTHRTTRKVFDIPNATLSHLRSTFRASEKWYWQSRKFCPKYLAPTPQCIRLRAMAKY